jgi:hypothetical protein
MFGRCERLFFRASDVTSESMKSIVSPVAGLLVALLGFVPSVRAEISPFRVRVEQVSKSENEKFSKTSKRSLKIFVSNSSKEPAELIAKYWFFGREAKDKDIVKLDEGAKPVSSKPLGTEMVESGIVTATFEEEHSSGYSKGKAGKKSEATGTKILGYAVQVFQGEKVVAEFSDPPSMKEQIEKAYPIKLPGAKK